MTSRFLRIYEGGGEDCDVNLEICSQSPPLAAYFLAAGLETEIRNSTI